MLSFKLKSKSKDVIIGYGNPVVVNVNIGVSSCNNSSYKSELEKIDTLCSLKSPPDLMMDLSLTNKAGYLYDDITKRFHGPIGFIPHYACKNRNGKLDEISLVDEVVRAVESGISWIVIHLTPCIEIVDLAIKTRKIPLASRSAVIVIEDMIKSNRKRSIYWNILDEIIGICVDNSVAISLGGAFRPAITNAAMDVVHIMELEKFHDIINILKEFNIKYLIEGIGHLKAKDIQKFNRIMNDFNCPVMPLGPLFADYFNKDDHFVNAMSFFAAVISGGNYSIINSLTPSEHSGGIPSINDILSGYQAARSCANLCNTFLGYNKPDNENLCTDLSDLNLLNCNRCLEVCPNKFIIQNIENIESWISSEMTF